MDDWIEYVREHAKAERELKIEKWVYISIEYSTKTRDRIVLHTYDLPRKLYERCSWIVRWRVSRLQCLHPKKDIHLYFSYYDKRPGLSTGFDSAMSKLSAAKAQISIAERKEKEYIEYQRTNNLFFLTNPRTSNCYGSMKNCERKICSVGATNPFYGSGFQSLTSRRFI